MSFSEFIAHRNRYTNLFNAAQATQIRYPQYRKQNSETDTAQQKQCKQPWRFQTIQRVQPNFTTDGIRNFIAQQKQRKQDFLTDGKNIFTYSFQPIQQISWHNKNNANN